MSLRLSVAWILLFQVQNALWLKSHKKLAGKSSVSQLNLQQVHFFIRRRAMAHPFWAWLFTATN